MVQKDYWSLIERAGEIEKLFVSGQQIVHHVNDMIFFLKETLPVLEDVNESLLQISRQMPVAAEKIDQVSESTELAATDILDHVDRIVANADRLQSLIKQAAQQDHKQRMRQNGLILSLASLLDGERETELAGIRQELEKLAAQSAEKSTFSQLETLCSEIQKTAEAIMIRMQNQDFVSQQLMAANAVIHSIQNRMVSLLRRFGHKQVGPGKEVDDSFDPIAVYDARHRMQELADAILCQADEAMPGKKEDTPVQVVSCNEIGEHLAKNAG